MGINIVLWNYRGYGRSKNRCWKWLTSHQMQRDGEYVVQYVRSNYAQGKLGIHGTSLGGSVASYAASKCVVDYVLIDRTFSSLPEIAYWISYQGSCASKTILNLFKFFSCGWSCNTDEHYRQIFPETYKVFTQDTNDEIIAFKASL
jgi:alpha/beta superfamily hydrolase